MRKLILDIGCNDGEDGYKLLDKYPGMELHAFEPNKSIAYKGTGVLWYLAVGNVNDVVILNLSESDKRKRLAASSSIKQPKEHLNLFPDVKFGNSIKVNCVKLDTWHYLGAKLL